jgi:hypothetical protein
MPRTKTDNVGEFLSWVKQGKPCCLQTPPFKSIFTKERNPTMYYIELHGNFGNGLVKYGNLSDNILSSILSELKNEITKFV